MAGHVAVPVRGSASKGVMAQLSVSAILCTCLAFPAGAQQVFTYTNISSGEHELALGYPVPRPVESQTPVNGFRSYGSLHARLQALALEPFINSHQVGKTIKGRRIWAYTVSDPDAVTVDGFKEPAFFINGTIHAREWVSPEVVTGILERFAERGNDGGLYQYLVENTKLVAIPVLNVDGFLQTQKYPAKVILGTDPRFPDSAPRDGRMRRKNMRGADQNLFSFDDHLNGVDLNRNNPPFAPSPRASGNPDSLIFHGEGRHNQPETKALAEAVKLAPGDELRLYTDFHSFAASFFDWRTGNQRRNAIHGRLIALAIDILRAQGSLYSRRPDGPGQGIGSTDEYFAETFQIPSWTLELEPDGGKGGTQYGGSGVTHSGFILPDSEIARVRDEIANTYATLFYAQAGPPAVKAMKVFNQSGGLVYAGEWQRAGNKRREFVVTVDGTLRAGVEYRLWVAFDKPMRRREDGEVIPYPVGTNIALKPTFKLTGDEVDITFGAEGQWLNASGSPGYLRYPDDAFMAPFTLPSEVVPEQITELTLSISVQDFAEQSLDADPATVVDWGGGHWTGYESTDGSLGDSGGTDSTLSLAFSTEGVDTIAFQQLEYQVAEGSLLRLPVVREGEGEGAVSALVSFSAGPPIGAIPVSWADGETGVKFVEFPISDNLTVGPVPQFGPFQAAVSVTSGPAVATSEAVDIEVLDNDFPERGVYNVLYVRPLACLECSPAPLGLAYGASLHSALEAAAATELESVRINLADNQTYEFSLGDTAPDANVSLLPPIKGDVTIAGNDSSIVYLRQEDVPRDGVRLIHVLPGANLTLRGLGLAGGDLGGTRTGGAILNEGTLLAQQVIFRANRANRAGALNNRGEATIINSSFVNNHADHSGGAIYNQGTLLLEGVTFSNNDTDAKGGAVFNSGQATVRSSTFAENAANKGAAVFSTGSAKVSNSLLADGNACAGHGIKSAGYNLNPDGNCGFNAVGDVEAADAGLAPFDPDAALYPLSKTSPAVDAGNPSGCIGSDPRGAPRPFAESGVDVRCDIGAFERAPMVHRGLWWNPDRPGHGIDLQQASNRLVLTWFTFEMDGDPVWYQAVAPFTDTVWTAELNRFSYDFDNNQVNPQPVGTVSLTFDSGTEATFAWDLSAIGQGTGSEPFEPYTPVDEPPVFDVTGLWAALDQGGWGLSVDVQGDLSIITLYYYDAEGNPRWVQGVGAATTDTETMLGSITGFCPNCALVPTDVVPAGSLDLQFLTRFQGHISTDFSYPGAEGGDWQRDVDLGVLSSPVP